MSLEEEPPSLAQAELPLSESPLPIFRDLNHGAPVQLARAARARFVVSPASNEFRKRHFPGVKTAEWNDWRWQNRNRIRSLEQLERMITVTDDERAAILRHEGPLPIGVTPYYMSLIDPADPSQGLRRTTIPTLAEFDRTPGEEDDPLGEDGHSPVPGLVHRYPGPRAAARHEFLLGLLPLLHASAARRRERRARAAQGRHRPGHRVHRGDAGRPRLPDLGRRPAVARRGPARVRAVALARDPAPRVHPHRQQAARRAADARDAGADEDAAPLPSALDEPALHAPRRGDARGRRGLRAARPTPAFRSAARPCCSRASTTTSRR